MTLTHNPDKKSIKYIHFIIMYLLNCFILKIIHTIDSFQKKPKYQE